MWILQMNPWDDFLLRLRDLGQGTQVAALNMLIALAVLLLGWGVAVVVSQIARGLLKASRIDEGLRGLIGGQVAGPHAPASFIAWAIYWVILTVAIMLSLDTLGFNLAASLGARLEEVVPRIFAAAVLFAVGALVAMVLGGLTRRFLETAGMRGAKLRGQLVTGVVTGFAALVALDQLGFAAQFVMALGICAVGALGLALGLAFGLGCRDLARDFVVEYLRSLDEEGPKRPA